MKLTSVNSFSATIGLAALLVLVGCETAPPVAPPTGEVTTGTVAVGGTTGNPDTQIAPPGPRPVTVNPIGIDPPPPPVAATPSRTPAELALAEGVDIYNQGNNYAAAIKRLQEAKKLASDSVYIQQDADKFTAFSFCLMNLKVRCRQHFVMLLSKDSSYELSNAEANHPMWGATFKEAKASLIKKPPVKK
jgi:hypothetical protein